MTRDVRGLRVGIVGAGGIADAHWRGYRQAGAAVVALAELDDAARERRSAEWGVPNSYRDYRELLADPAIEAVSVCLPNALHDRAAIEALEAGKHVLCEKPVAVSIARAEAMIVASERTGLTLCINHQLRSSGPAQRARELVAAGTVGDLAFVRLRQAHDWGGQPPPASFTSRASAGGGTLLDNGCHLFDLARFFAGEVEDLFTHSATRKHATELEDTAHVALRFTSGALGSIEVSWSATGKDEGFWIYGTEGALEYTIRGGRPTLRHSYRTSPWTTWTDTDVAEYAFAGASAADHSRHALAFLRAIVGLGPNPCSGQDGLEALRLVLAAYQSAERGLPVEVQQAAGSLLG